MRTAGLVIVVLPLLARAAAGQAPRSPHWPHVRVMVSDYRISYLDDAARRAREYAWTAAHFDQITLDFRDRGSVPVYRRLNPTATLYRYALNWTVRQPGRDPEDGGVTYYRQMERWWAARRLPLEEAFLHDARRCPAGSAPTPACRITLRIWNQDRWVIDPGDANVREFQSERLRRLASDVDGLFIDEHSSGDILERLTPLRLREFPRIEDYQRALNEQLRRVRAAMPRKQLLLNTAEYIAPWDVEMARIAGGAHGEALNTPWHHDMEARWRFVERLLAAGGVVNFGVGGAMPASFGAGNSSSPLERRRLWELASYYLVVPTPPDRLRHHIGVTWDRPYEPQWIGAIAVNVGAPRGARRILREGRDARGQPYRVWSRELANALVVVRPVLDWNDRAHDDRTAVELPLPAGASWRPLRADGSLGAPVARLRLRAAEAAILVRGGR